MSSLYVHIPLCRSKCLYCDFYSLPGALSRAGELADALLAEARERRHELPAPIRTIYFGGGTPSLLPADTLVALLKNLSGIFDSIPAETTVELNPDDVTEEYISTLLRGGFNRFSMGVQTFHDPLLHAMGRRHTADGAARACSVLSRAGVNYSIDLIFGLPGQSSDIWREDVERALSIRPPHISCYALMLEEGTALTRLVDRGALTLPDDSETAAMYTFLSHSLVHAGYQHYEISNYSLPGMHSRHNSAYWTSRPYLGLGPGAHSYDGRRLRTANPPDLRAYLRRYFRGDADAYTPEREHLTDTELREEYLLTRLRTARGISMRSFAGRFGEEAACQLSRRLQPLLEAGSVISAATDGDRLRIAPGAWLTSDPLIASLF